MTITRAGCLLAAGLALCLYSDARAGLLEEAHVRTISWEDAEPDSITTRGYQMPQFDTMGGTRELLGFRERYFMVLTGTRTVSDNTSPSSGVQCQVRYGLEWWGEVDSAAYFPHHSDFGGGPAQILGAYGAFVAPLTPGWGPDFFDREYEVERLITDPAALARFTGTGTVSILGVFRTLPLTAQPLNGAPDEYLFDPDLVTIDLDTASLEHTITYLYQAVPGPGSVGLLTCAGVCAARRRRR